MKPHPLAYSPAIGILLTLASTLAAAEPPRYGAEDPVPETSPRYGAEGFLPTPQTPIGFQADGSGWYPGAKLEVLEWWDGRPGRSKVGSTMDPKPVDQPVFVDNVPKNILWKAPLPGHAGNHPIVVGDRLIATVWPDFTICFDRKTGKELWRDRLMATALPVLSKEDGRTLGPVPDEQTARKNEILYGMGCAMVYLYSGLRTPAAGDDPGPADYPRVNLALERMGEWRKTLETLEPTLVPLLDQEIDLAKRFLAGEHAIMGAGPKTARELQEKLGGELRKMMPQFGDPWGQNNYKSKKNFTGEISRLTGLSLNPTAWGSMLALHLAAPASDGSTVVVRFANGQLGAYDIATGKRLWAWRDPWCNTHWTWHCISPRIHGDTVFINLMGGDRPKQAGLYCVETRTGAIRWSLPHKQGPSTVHGNSYPITTPVTMDVPDGAGGKTTIVVNFGGEILDAKDGKVLHRFPEKHHMSAAYPFAFGGRLFAPGLECDNVSGGNPGKMGVYQPSIAQGALQMPLMETIPMITYYGVSVGNGRRLFGGSKSLVYDLNSKTISSLGKHAWTGMTIIGDHFLYLRPDASGRRERLDGITTAGFEIFEANPQPFESLRLLSGRGLLGGTDQPADIYHDTWLKGIDKLPLMQARNGGFGNPFTSNFGHIMSGPVAAGNRLYVQGSCHLYCIGPAVQGTPSDDPAVVAAIRAEADPAKLLAKCSDASAQYRFEAVKRLGALKASLAKDLSDRLATMVVDDPYEEIRAQAVLVLNASDPKGRAGWDRLMADYAVNFWIDPPPKEGWAYYQNRDRSERRDWVGQTLRVLGETGRTKLEQHYAEMAAKPVSLRMVLELASQQRWRIEPLVKAGLEVAQRGPLAKTDPWCGQVPVNTSNAGCLPGYFAAIDAASDPSTAEILLKAYPKNWTLYPTFARNLKPEALLAWIEGCLLGEGCTPAQAIAAWTAIGPAANPSIQRVLAALDERLKKLEAEGKKNPGLQGNRDTIARALETNRE